MRPEQGYPVRLFLPGYEGNMSVKWLRRIKVTAEPTMTKDETSKYSDLQPNGRSLLFTFPMEVKSVITSPSGRQKMQGPGLYQISGLAWSGFGRIRRVEVSADGGQSWARSRARRAGAVEALTRFRMPWRWDGSPSVLQSRAIDETGAVQPTRAALIAARGAAIPLSLQRDPELERRGGGRNQQRLCLASTRVAAAAALSPGSRCAAAQEGPDLGVPATPEQVAGWDISIGPDGAGLPPGSGTAAAGKVDLRGEVPRLPRRRRRGAAQRSARRRAGHDARRRAVRTVGSYWPYATTVFDYVRRAMPIVQPQSLTADETYALTAYLLR